MAYKVSATTYDEADTITTPLPLLSLYTYHCGYIGASIIESGAVSEKYPPLTSAISFHNIPTMGLSDNN